MKIPVGKTVKKLIGKASSDLLARGKLAANLTCRFFGIARKGLKFKLGINAQFNENPICNKLASSVDGIAISNLKLQLYVVLSMTHSIPD